MHSIDASYSYAYLDDCVCVSECVCVFFTIVSRAKMAEPTI